MRSCQARSWELW